MESRAGEGMADTGRRSRGRPRRGQTGRIRPTRQKLLVLPITQSHHWTQLCGKRYRGERRGMVLSRALELGLGCVRVRNGFRHSHSCSKGV